MKFYFSLGKTLTKYVLLKNAKCKVMFTEAYLEPTGTPTMELFFTLVKPYFKNVLNSIKLSLGSIFYTIHPTLLSKKLNYENFGRKSLLLTIEQFF